MLFLYWCIVLPYIYKMSMVPEFLIKMLWENAFVVKNSTRKCVQEMVKVSLGFSLAPTTDSFPKPRVMWMRWHIHESPSPDTFPWTPDTFPEETCQEVKEKCQEVTWQDPFDGAAAHSMAGVIIPRYFFWSLHSSLSTYLTVTSCRTPAWFPPKEVTPQPVKNPGNFMVIAIATWMRRKSDL